MRSNSLRPRFARLGLGVVYVAAVVLALAALGVLLGDCRGCTDPEQARRTLEAQGYTEIQLTGYDWLGCGDRDGSCDSFVATSPNGTRVSGVVGCGYLGCGKACTVRLK
jgi:hypothetical protein